MSARLPGCPGDLRVDANGNLILGGVDFTADDFRAAVARGDITPGDDLWCDSGIWHVSKAGQAQAVSPVVPPVCCDCGRGVGAVAGDGDWYRSGCACDGPLGEGSGLKPYSVQLDYEPSVYVADPAYVFGDSLRATTAAMRSATTHYSLSQETWGRAMVELEAGRRFGRTIRTRMLLDAEEPTPTPPASPKTRNRAAAKRARAARKITRRAHA